MAIKTVYSGGSAAWNNVNWSSGFPNAIDTYAELNAAAGATLTIGANLSYTLSSLYTNDSTPPFTDWVVAGSNATTSKLIFATSSNTSLPYIYAADGATISVGLSGSQGLKLEGGYAAGDTLTISNANNTLYGPLRFDYTYLTIISGKLIASGTINSNNNFAGVSYTGILGLLGKVDVQTSGLSIRNASILGDLNLTSELSTSNNSYVTSNPDTFTTNLKISTPMVLATANEQGISNTAGVVVEYTGIISGVSPNYNGSSIGVFGIQTGPSVNATGSATLRLSNTANTFTNTSPSSHVSSFSDTVDATAILEYKTIANSGFPSSLGAGTGGVMGAARGSIYRCIGAGGTTNRQLVNLGGGTSNYSLENNGSGPVIFNNATAETFFNQWPILGGTNLDLNEIAQPMYHPRPLIKDGAGRWVLSGEKRYLGVAAYNSGPKPWLTTTARNSINSYYYNEFVGIAAGYLRFNSNLVLRNQNTNTTNTSTIQIYDGGALELNGTGITYDYQVGTTAIYYNTLLYLAGNGPSNDGAIINISGSNSIAAPNVYARDNSKINISSGSLTFTGDIYSEDLNNIKTITISGSGNSFFTTNSRILAANITKEDTGTLKLDSSNTSNSRITSKQGIVQLSSSNPSLTPSSAYLIVSGGIAHISSSTAGNIFTDIVLDTGSFVHALNSNLQLIGTVIHTNTTASNVFSYTFPTSRTLQISGGGGFAADESKNGLVDITFNYNGTTQSNIKTAANSVLVIQVPYSSSSGFGFNKSGAGTAKLMSSASYLGTNNLSEGTTVAKHQNAFGRSSLVIQGGTLSTAADMHVQIQSSLTLNGGTVSFGSNV